jgi:hypothetical protein
VPASRRSTVLPWISALLLLCVFAASAHASIVFIGVDENGGSFANNPDLGIFSTLSFDLLPDPGPGGQASVLTFDLQGPPSLVAGDVLIFEPGSGSVGDVIRFNPDRAGGDPFYTASLLFYSQGPPFDSLADTPSGPGALYANNLSFTENPLGDVYYTPAAGQPGFVSGFAVNYLFRSDNNVPEPGTWSLLLAGLSVIASLTYPLRRVPPKS